MEEHAVRTVLAALRDEGVQPQYHRAVRRRTEQEWPALGKALRLLEQAFPPERK
jgi:hypothetical protein